MSNIDFDAILADAKKERIAKGGDNNEAIVYCERVLKWCREERKEGRADGTTSRLSILAAELMTRQKEVPEEQIRWQAFAEQFGIASAIEGVVSTLPRQMALEAMEQATKDMDAGTAKNVDVRAGYHAATLIARQRPHLKMVVIDDWLGRDLAGAALAPEEMRVDEGWVFDET